MRTKSLVLGSLIGLSLLAAVYQGLAYWYEEDVTSRFLALWSLVFVFLLVLWVDMDSKDRPEIYRPHEYGQLVFFWWLPYVPYYFWRTRKTRGLLLLMGFVVLYFLGHLVQWAMYFAL